MLQPFTLERAFVQSPTLGSKLHSECPFRPRPQELPTGSSISLRLIVVCL
jgi:hypothetical protein